MPSLEYRLRSVSKRLFQALEGGLSEALSGQGGIHRLRPVVLTSELGLDKSLASRIAKSLRENDELKALHAVPTPKGLQLVARALKERGISKASLQALASSIDAYREILTEFSGGRTGLEATLAGWIPEERAGAERDARRLIFRGLTTVEGTRIGTIYNSIYVLPSATDPRSYDILVVAVREDLRRLRADEEIPLTAITGENNAGDGPVSRPLVAGTEFDGDFRAGSDPRSLLIEELCSNPAPKLEFVSRGKSAIVRVSKDSLDVNEFATVVFGWRLDDYFSDKLAEEGGYPHFSFTASLPAECMTVDLFIHKDFSLSGEPIAGVMRLMDVDHGAMSTPPLLGSRERTRAPKLECLANTSTALNTGDLRDCESIAKHATQLAGIELSSFNVHRTRIEFPMTTEVLTVWMPFNP